jgi:DNA-binding protein Fis
VLVNVVDQPAECGFIFPSVLRRGELQIAVSTGGRSPALAREIRRHLEPLFGPDCADLVDEVGRERTRARAVAGTPRERVEAGERVVELALGTMRRDDDAPGLVGRAIPRLVDDLIAAGSGALYVEAVRLLERALFSHVLRMTGGNQLRAARALGLNRNTLRKRCRELGIEVGRRPPVSLSSHPPRASRYSSSV